MELTLLKSIVTSAKVCYTTHAATDEEGELVTPTTLCIPKDAWFDLGKPEAVTVTVKEES